MCRRPLLKCTVSGLRESVHAIEDPGVGVGYRGLRAEDLLVEM